MSQLKGRLLLQGHFFPGVVEFEAGRIIAVREDPGLDERERSLILAPGLVDLHVHGFGGQSPDTDLGAMAVDLARAGTTAFQPTLFPDAPEALGALCERLWSTSEALRRDPAASGAARVLGLHLEGPFVNPDAAGALPRAALALPSPEALAAILGPASGEGRGVRTMTLAPELSGADALIAELGRSHVRVSLGHSLADAAQAHAAVRAGASGVTHLYNAMAPFHHRAPGLAGVALTEELVFAEIIGDLVHVGPEAFELALRAREPLGLCLVSDALAGAGTGCERFHAAGREHVAREGAFFHQPEPGPGGEPRSPALSGSACSQLEMIRRLVAAEVCYLEDALTMATASPARALGLAGELGEIAPGARADLIALSGDELGLVGVWVGGRRIVG